MNVWLRAGATAALGGVSLVVPLRWATAPACVPPQAAAARAESVLPPLGLPWGKLRGWERWLDGWRLVWQPAHGAWTVAAWVPDGAGEVRVRLSAAPWLPGARLSREAARLLAGSSGEGGVATELTGRRDWRFAGAALVGGVRTGSLLEPRQRPRGDMWAAVLLGMALAGAAARTILPGVPSRFFRGLILTAAAVLLLFLPALVALAASGYRPGVRPWVATLAGVGAGAVVLAGVVAAAVRFPVVAGGRTAWWVVGAALCGGALLGVVAPFPWAAALVGTRGAMWTVPAVTVLLGWLACLAADGLRELTRWAGTVGRLAMAGLAVAAVASPSPAAPLAVAACGAASWNRATGAWVSLLITWGWVAASLLAGSAWPGAVRLSLGVALAGWVVAGVHAVRAK